MVKRTLLIFAVACAAILVGCSKTETMGNSNTRVGDSNKAATTATPAPSTTTPSTPATTAASDEKIGVPECDELITRYDACVAGKVPEAQRAQYQSTLKQWRDSWRQLAQNSMTKGTLAVACKQAAEQAKTSMKSYGCDF